jgi:uncharacterized caspase-like protein
MSAATSTGRHAHFLRDPFGGRGLRAGTDGNSPYTKALAKTIRTPGLDIFQSFNRVGVVVKKATGGSQQPWISISPIEGEFYFVVR